MYTKQEARAMTPDTDAPKEWTERGRYHNPKTGEGIPKREPFKRANPS